MAAGVREIFDSMEYGPAPESAALAQEWIEQHNAKFKLFIGGEFKEPSTKKWFDAFNPGTGSKIAEIAQAGQPDIDLAVESASKAQKAWMAKSGFERAKVLYALARQVQKHSRLFAVLESLDNGKPIRETRDIDIPLVARHFYHHAGWAQLVETEFPDHEPVGVVGQIIPWNFPLLMLAWKIAPAIAAGNAVILKPAEFTSLSALLFAEICEAAGVPPGLINIVTGDGETGKLIIDHPGIDKIAFTGSTEVGRHIRKATAGSGKKLSLELGGKSPFIVFEDADLDSAIEGIVDAIWFNQGQVCCAGSRLLVQEGIADRFLGKLRARMETLRVGDPLDKAIDIGAIVAPVQLERIAQLVQQGKDEGATLHQPSWACPKEGWFYPPTLLTNVSPASTVAQIEIFGPVLVSMTFRTPTEAVALANNTVYGLASSVWTENIGLAHDVAARIKAGAVWINCTNQFDAASGFGGYRESGYGREGGKEGMGEYLKLRGLDARKFGTSDPNSRTPELPLAAVDRTYKQYVGGKQARPDGGYSFTVTNATGDRTGEVALGNRKDIRNAVEAAIAAQPKWGASTMHARAQVLYFLGENLDARRADFAEFVGEDEVQAAIDSIFKAAAWADKHDGLVRGAPFTGVVYTVNEPLGIVSILAPNEPSFVGAIEPIAFAIAMGNTVVAVPSETMPLAVMEFIQVLETSDVPAGIVNLVSGKTAELAPTLAEHEGVDGIWAFGPKELAAPLEIGSITNLKQTWFVDENSAAFGHPALQKEMLRRSTQVKNVWVPVGE